MLARETGLCLTILRLLAASAGGWTPISELAPQLGLSRSHAGKLCHRLQRAGYLETRRGVKGGVTLSPAARDASLYDLAVDLEDPFIAARCILLREACVPDEPCPMHEVWSSLHEQTLEYFRRCPVAGDSGPRVDPDRA